MALKRRQLMMVLKYVFYHIVSVPDIGPTYIQMQKVMTLFVMILITDVEAWITTLKETSINYAALALPIKPACQLNQTTYI